MKNSLFSVSTCGKTVSCFINLKNLRKNCGYTQTELAQRVGCSKNTISSIDRGEFYPTLPLMLKLCIALCCTYDDLLICETVGYYGKNFMKTY